MFVMQTYKQQGQNQTEAQKQEQEMQNKRPSSEQISFAVVNLMQAAMDKGFKNQLKNIRSMTVFNDPAVSSSAYYLQVVTDPIPGISVGKTFTAKIDTSKDKLYTPGKLEIDNFYEVPQSADAHQIPYTPKEQLSLAAWKKGEDSKSNKFNIGGYQVTALDLKVKIAEELQDKDLKSSLMKDEPKRRSK